MKFVMNMLKGMVMGIANIIPGVSGGTMAVSMGIYDVLIHAVTHIFKEFKKSLMALLPIGVGMLLGIVGLSRVIEWMFGVIPIQTNLLFIGLIVGGLPAVWQRVKGASIRIWHIIGCVAFFALVVGLAMLNGVTGTDADLSFSLVNCLLLFLVGIIAAGTMVVPGVSGSMMLMLMGYYEPILGTINGLIDALLVMDVNAILGYCGVLIPFGLGVVVGIILIAKLIEMLLTKAPYMVFWCIIGLIAASPIAIIMVNDFSGINVVSIVTGLLAFAVGCVIAYFLGNDSKKENEE